MLTSIHYKQCAPKLLHFISKRFFNKTLSMANSRFDYVRDFERDDTILPNCWIVVRIDGKTFHKFTQKHDFNKPNDDNGMLNPLKPIGLPHLTC